MKESRRKKRRAGGRKSCVAMTLGRVTARREDETLAGLTLRERISV